MPLAYQIYPVHVNDIFHKYCTAFPEKHRRKFFILYKERNLSPIFPSYPPFFCIFLPAKLPEKELLDYAIYNENDINDNDNDVSSTVHRTNRPPYSGAYAKRDGDNIFLQIAKEEGLL